jgi:hypothetical protein
MKNFSRFIFTIVLMLLIAVVYGQKKYTYESVDNDPLKARIYTLDNGLKVYLTVYKDVPRIQTARTTPTIIRAFRITWSI